MVVPHRSGRLAIPRLPHGPLALRGAALNEVACVPRKGYGHYRILSNHEKLERTDRMAMMDSRLYVRMDHAWPLAGWNGVLRFGAGPGGGRVVVENISGRPRQVRAVLVGPEDTVDRCEVLASGESLEVAVSGIPPAAAGSETLDKPTP